MSAHEPAGTDVRRFNTSATEPRDDIGVVSTLSVLPASVLGSLFGIPGEVFDRIPRTVGRVGITRHPR